MSYLDDPGPFRRGDGGALVLSVTGAAFITTAALIAWTLATSGPGSIAAFALGGFFAFVAMSMIGILAALIVGLPLTILLSAYRLERPWTYPILGAATGGLIAWLLFGRGTTEGFLLPMLGSIPGGIAGLIWWTFHRRHFQDIRD